MADLKKLAEELVNLSVKEVNELAGILKDEYGIEPAAAAAVVAAPAAGAGADAVGAGVHVEPEGGGQLSGVGGHLGGGFVGGAGHGVAPGGGGFGGLGRGGLGLLLGSDFRCGALHFLRTDPLVVGRCRVDASGWFVGGVEPHQLRRGRLLGHWDSSEPRLGFAPLDGGLGHGFSADGVGAFGGLAAAVGLCAVFDVLGADGFADRASDGLWGQQEAGAAGGATVGSVVGGAGGVDVGQPLWCGFAGDALYGYSGGVRELQLELHRGEFFRVVRFPVFGQRRCRSLTGEGDVGEARGPGGLERIWGRSGRGGAPSTGGGRREGGEAVAMAMGLAWAESVAVALATSGAFPQCRGWLTGAGVVGVGGGGGGGAAFVGALHGQRGVFFSSAFA